MAKSSRLLFLTLNTFSATGGIEKVCQALSMALHHFADQNDTVMKMMSVYDTTDEVKHNKYLPYHLCNGFSGKKITFSIEAIKEGIRSRCLVLSHINLLPIAWIIKSLSPQTKIILLAHGIEIWKIPPGFKKRMMRKIDKVVCVSRFTAQKVNSIFKVPSEKIEVINNALDPFLVNRNHESSAADMRKRYSIAETDFVLFTLSRLDSRERYKGYDYVIEALGNMVENHPNLKYVIGGKSDEAELDYINNLIRNYKLEKNIIITGFINDEELGAHYAMSDVFIMPSSEEGFGISFIESMFYGVPVIGGNADGSVDALADGQLGTLVTPGNIDSIKNGISFALKHKGENIPDRGILLKLFGFESYQEKWKNLLSTYY